MAASIIPLIIKLLVHDKYTLGTEAEAITEFISSQNTQQQQQQQPSTRNGQSQQPKNVPEPSSDGPGTGADIQEHIREVAAGYRPKMVSKLPVVHSGAELHLDASPGNGAASTEDSGRLVPDHQESSSFLMAHALDSVSSLSVGGSASVDEGNSIAAPPQVRGPCLEALYESVVYFAKSTLGFNRVFKCMHA
jgi:hypothetical protein